MARQANRRNPIEASSGNVFADLRLPDAAELDTKVRLAVMINRLVAAQRLNQVTAAARLKVSQPKISALKNYRLDGFSVERLMIFITALGGFTWRCFVIGSRCLRTFRWSGSMTYRLPRIPCHR